VRKVLIISVLLALGGSGFGQEKEPSLSNDSTSAKVSVTYHTNGNVKSNGHYIQNKKSGEWNYWDENGNLIKLEQFKNGLNHGDYIEYYSNGTIKVKGNYTITNEISIKHKYWFYYDDNGEKIKSIFYFEGIKYEYDKNNVLINKEELK
jgi:antitoxin component YwqK of YwqJK toxin-antitoxin module